METVNVGIDSQCLSYLIDAVVDVEEPTDVLAEEKKSLIRAWFYQPGTFYVTETVVNECSDIRNSERRELHDRFIAPLFIDAPIRDRGKVKSNVKIYMNAHSKENDCRILAEAKDLGLNVLLSYDGDFVKRLSIVENAVTLIKPSDYWTSLGIPRGAAPETVPANSNPLASESWWRW